MAWIVQFMPGYDMLLQVMRI